LRALLGSQGHGDGEPEVLGVVYASLLSLEGAAAVPLVAEALKAGDDTAAEAAFALADSRCGEALAALLTRCQQGADAWFGSVLLSAIALTRLPEAMDFLIAVVARDAREAPEAIEAIGRIGPSTELRGRVEQAIEEADSIRLRKAFQQHMPAIAE
jgi:hypothetical protein